jgi:hypothetical protein
MEAFLGKREVKEFYLSRVRAHREADQLIHGIYWQGGKGCAVGCTVHSGDHSAYERELGIPRILAKLEDGIFEALCNSSAMLWPERFLSAIEVGANLSMVWPRFAVWMLADPTWGVIQFARSAQSKKAIQDVADGYQGTIDGNKTPDWRALRDASYDADANAAADAAAYAAYAAAAADASYDAYADYAAAYAANAAASFAAADASYNADAAAYAARTKWRKAQAKQLLELLAAPR